MMLLIDSKPKGVRFDGDKGWVELFDEGAMAAEPKSVLGISRRRRATGK